MDHDHTRHPPGEEVPESETLARILRLAESNAREIGEARLELAEMRGLLDAWRNARGAIRTLTFISATARWLAWVGGSIAVFIFWLKSGGNPP